MATLLLYGVEIRNFLNSQLLGSSHGPMTHCQSCKTISSPQLGPLWAVTDVWSSQHCFRHAVSPRPCSQPLKPRVLPASDLTSATAGFPADTGGLGLAPCPEGREDQADPRGFNQKL